MTHIPVSAEQIATLIAANPAFASVEEDLLTTAANLAAAFTQRGYQITVADVCNWIEYEIVPDGNCAAVETAVEDFMGKLTVEYYESLARMVPALEYHLGVSTEQRCGGIDLSLSYLGLTKADRPFSIIDRPYPA